MKIPKLENDKLIIEQISFVVGNTYLISFQEKYSDIFDHIKQRLIEGKGVIREKEILYLLYLTIESIADDYLKTINQIETKMNNIDFNLLQEPSSEDLEKLGRLKKDIYFIKKSILPIRDFSLIFKNGKIDADEGLNKYFFEINDLCLTIIDECDIIINSIESNINIFFSIQGHRMNQIMKTLTVVATIFIPLTFIAGIYG